MPGSHNSVVRWSRKPVSARMCRFENKNQGSYQLLGLIENPAPGVILKIKHSYLLVKTYYPPFKEQR